jgi:hypothetical protein
MTPATSVGEIQFRLLILPIPGVQPIPKTLTWRAIRSLTSLIKMAREQPEENNNEGELEDIDFLCQSMIRKTEKAV